MSPEKPEANAARAPMGYSGDLGTFQTHVDGETVPEDDAHMISEHHVSDGSSLKTGAPALNPPVEGGDIGNQTDDKAKVNEDSAEGPSTVKPSADFPKLSPDMERYMRMEQVLFKHRKEWESNNSPHLYAFWSPRASADYRGGKGTGFATHGPWNDHWEYQTAPQYKRPNPFELANEFGVFPYPPKVEEKDVFDLTIDYGAARTRMRKNFEWDLDRLFLMEEVAIRNRKQEEDARKRANLEKLGKPSTTRSKGDQTGADSTEPNLKAGPALSPNYVQWDTFRLLTNVKEIEAHVIDVLVGDPIVEDDEVGSTMFANQTRRFEKPQKSVPGDTNTPSQAPLPERIRIHSSLLRKILSGMLSATPFSFGELSSFVVIRPYKSLFYCYEGIKSMIEKLEERFSEDQKPVSLVEADTVPLDETVDGESGQNDSNARSSATKDGSKHGPTVAGLQPRKEGKDLPTGEDMNLEKNTIPEDPNDPVNSQKALQHLKVLRDFMDSEIVAKAAYLQKTECKKVFFADLWYLFRPGDEIIGRDGKQAYRVIHVSSLRHRKTQPWDIWRWYNSQNSEDRGTQKQNGPFSITCVYIDFDGSSIGPVSKTINFKQFDGQMDITSLEVYPVQLHHFKKTEISDNDWRELQSLVPEKRYRQYLINRGAKFLSVLAIEPMYYAGPTLGVRDDIESQVVIDFDAAFTADDTNQKETVRIDETEREKQKEERWRPRLEMLIGIPESQDDSGKEFGSTYSADCCRLDAVYDDNYIDNKQRSQYINSLLPSSGVQGAQPSIAVCPRLLIDLKNTDSKTGYSISEDELVIMSHRVFGFVLRHRQWGICHILLCFEEAYSLLTRECSPT